MGTEDFNKELISYLYDEMSTEERLEFEKAMETDPELRKEFESLQEVRKGLAHLHDKEVMEPFFLWGKRGFNQWPNPFRRNALIMFKPVIAIAASIVIALLVGYYTNFSISYNDKGLLIGFNKGAQEPTIAGLTEEQVADLVKQEIARNNTVLLSRLDNTENSFNSKLAALESSQNRPPVFKTTNNLITKDELNTYLDQNQQSNSILLKDYLQTASVQQQEYFQSILTEFSDYLQDQRNNDLLMIQRSLVSLKDNQDQQKQQTETLLANIINTVNNQNN